MSTYAIARPLLRTSRATALAVALCAVCGALASLGLMAITGSSHGSPRAGASARSFAAPGGAFTVALPAGWTALSPARLASLHTHPAAVLRRADGRGLVVVRPVAPTKTDSARLVRSLGAAFRARFAGFHPVSARLARVRAGRAFVYTFVRAPRRTVQTLTLASVGGRAYAIDAVVPAGAATAARDAGAIVASFGP